MFNENDQVYARNASHSIFVQFFLNEEREGLLLFRFGDIQLGARILDALRTRIDIEDQNYYWEKQAEKGRVSKGLDIPVPTEVESLLAEHLAGLYDTLQALREEWGVGWEHHAAVPAHAS